MTTSADAGCRSLRDTRPDDYPYLAVLRFRPSSKQLDSVTGVPWPAVEIEVRSADAPLRKHTIVGPHAVVLGVALFDGNQPTRYHWVRIEGPNVCIGPTAPFQGWKLAPWNP